MLVRDSGANYGGYLDTSRLLMILIVNLVGIRDDKEEEGNEEDNENE